MGTFQTEGRVGKKKIRKKYESRGREPTLFEETFCVARGDRQDSGALRSQGRRMFVPGDLSNGTSFPTSQGENYRAFVSDCQMSNYSFSHQNQIQASSPSMNYFELDQRIPSQIRDENWYGRRHNQMYGAYSSAAPQNYSMAYRLPPSSSLFDDK
eukprot:TRINITY_DN3119_c0_g1_i4.p1 TRINITY_DN3119_c0_g1~~TRINITY_DN3119_c0_g1_i4.p1  ORF type:complete len:155 (+),score=19.92 TRINITY_DN3119_c0_g1_i4:35-499(+)